MIRADWTQDKASNLIACRLHGHAGYDEEGKDIVCAAVSVLSVNCVNSLEAILHVAPQVTENRDGLLSFSLPENLPEESMRQCQILMKSLQLGLQDVAQAYPHYLKVSISNGGKYNDQT